MRKGASSIPPIKKKTGEIWALCSLLCCNIFLILSIGLCAFLINNFACVYPYVKIPPTSNATCQVEAASSWIASSADGCSSANLTYCEQAFVAMMVPSPLDFPKITGCEQGCTETYAMLKESENVFDLYMISMVLQILAVVFVCCMVLAAIGDDDFAAVGAATMCCFTTLTLVIFGIGVAAASVLQISVGELQTAQCLNVDDAQGKKYGTTIQTLVELIDSSFVFGVVSLSLGVLELLIGTVMACGSKKQRSMAAGAILCFQLIFTIMTCVSYGSAVNIKTEMEILYSWGDEFNATTNGWCTTMSNTTARCVGEERGPTYTSMTLTEAGQYASNMISNQPEVTRGTGTLNGRL